jgi:hypothetical protein
MATLIDSYSESNHSEWYKLLFTGVSSDGQRVYVSEGMELDSCEFNSLRTGNPTGNILAKVYAHDIETGRCGSLLAESDAVDVSTISDSGSLIGFNFSNSNRIALGDETYYIIQAVLSGGSNDSSNNISLSADAISPTHGGYEVWYESGWQSTAGADMIFYLYGEPFATNKPSAHFNGLFNKFGAQLI